MDKNLKEPVEKDLRLTFFIAGDVALTPRDELGESGGIRHARFVTEAAQCVSNDAADELRLGATRHTHHCW
jgi:hypothetical protein